MCVCACVYVITRAAELLTAGKLSELACLTLFLMYEKKLGTESFWQPYIKVSMACATTSMPSVL